MQNYTHLCSLSSNNIRSFEAIHGSLFVLSLDHWSAPSVPANESDGGPVQLTFPTENIATFNSQMRCASQKSCKTTSASLRLQSKQGFSNPTPLDLSDHQERTRAPPALQNRFLDKPLQIVVERTTRAGACGEHAAVDALVPSVVCEWAVARASGACLVGGLENVPLERDVASESCLSKEGHGTRARAQWERLDFVASPQIDTMIAQATHHAGELVADSDHEVLYFTEFGEDEIQRVGEFPPFLCLRPVI